MPKPPDQVVMGMASVIIPGQLPTIDLAQELIKTMGKGLDDKQKLRMMAVAYAAALEIISVQILGADPAEERGTETP